MKPRRNRLAVSLWCALTMLGCCSAAAQSPAAQVNPACSVTTSTVMMQHMPGRAGPDHSTIQGVACDTRGHTLPGVMITAVRSGGAASTISSNGEGIFRLLRLRPGSYRLEARKDGFAPQSLPARMLKAGELLTIKISLESTTGEPVPKVGTGMPGTTGPTAEFPLPSNYATDLGNLKLPTPWPLEVVPELAPIAARPAPDRWNAPMPEWDRYNRRGEFPYVKGHWYDPFNRNILKGDKPVFGQQWFFNFTGTSLTGINVRRLPVPSGISTEQPNEEGFFGKGEQFFTGQTFILSFDLFRGDTSFRPVDFRFRVTPEINLNFLQTRERGLVNVDVRRGTNRFDAHAGLQEAFVEARIRDLSPNFDFVSVRAGIQQFVSDFRGFIFAEQQPGVRVFGNLRSNRVNYNLAYFYFLEKDTNSGLNTFNNRQQQVYIGNVFIQDFLTKGYTTEFSFHYNRDDPSVHFDENGFLVRPSPIGDVVNGHVIAHGIRAYYLGWASNGHIKRLNVNHAFYQVLGHDTFNPIAGRRVDINAQMAALELSIDKDWQRYYASVFYASGDSSSRFGPQRNGEAHGFDTIVDDTNFAGGPFSFFDQQGIPLTSTGVALTTPASLLSALRSNKLEGQANFVNPGMYVFNAGGNFKLTTNLTAFANTSYLRFVRTEPLQILLFQAPIRHSIGQDLGFGVKYRPKLSDNVIVTGGTSALFAGAGLKNLYTSKVLLSGFGSLALTF
jgi:hypothetical protein